MDNAVSVWLSPRLFSQQEKEGDLALIGALLWGGEELADLNAIVEESDLVVSSMHESWTPTIGHCSAGYGNRARLSSS
jgi:hypothetical protein